VTFEHPSVSTRYEQSALSTLETRIHQPIPLLSWASALDLHKVSALGSREAGPLPTITNERTTAKGSLLADLQQSWLLLRK